MNNSGLSPQQQAFVDAMVAGNVTKSEAARMAGYAPGSAHVQASRLLKNAKIKAAIDAGCEEARKGAVLTRQRSLELLAQIAEGKRKGSGNMDPVRAINESNKMQGFHEPERLHVTGSLVDRIRKRNKDTQNKDTQNKDTQNKD